MLTEDIKQKCVQADESDKEFRKFNNPARILGLICGLSLLAFLLIAQSDKDTKISTTEYVLLFISAITFGMAKYYSVKARPYKIEGITSVAMHCYRSYNLLENYQKTKLKSRKEKAQQEIRSAVDKISSGWSKFKEQNVVFKEFATPINDLIENLKEKFIPAIGSNEDTSIFRNLLTLENLILFFSKKDHFDFVSINSILNTYPSIEKKEITISEAIQKNRSVKTGLLWAFFVSVGGIVTLISRLAGGNDQTLIMVWVTVSTAAVTIYYSIIKKTTKI